MEVGRRLDLNSGGGVTMGTGDAFATGLEATDGETSDFGGVAGECTSASEAALTGGRDWAGFEATE